MTITKEARTAAEEFTERAPGLWKNDICAGAVYGEKGKELYSAAGGTVCHAFINPYRMRSKEEVSAVVNTMKNKDGIPQDAYREYVKWVVTGTPFSHFIVNANDIDTCCHGGVIIDASEANQAISLWLCKALRYTTEDKHRPTLWWNLVNRGVDPRMAFIACSSYSAHLVKNLTLTHNTLLCSPDKKKIKTFMKMRPVLAPQGKFGITGSNACGLIPGNDCMDDAFPKDNRRYEEVPDGWGGYTRKQVGILDLDGLAKLCIDLQKECC